MKLIATTIFVTLFASQAYGAFNATSVEANWSGFVDAPSGVASLTIEGMDDVGRVIQVKGIRGVGHSLIGTGSTQVSSFLGRHLAQAVSHRPMAWLSISLALSR